MGKFNDLLKSKLRPTDVLVFYKPTEKVGDKYGAFVEHRAIEEGKMGAGSPLEVDTLAKIMRVVNNYVRTSTTFVTLHGVVPPNLLYTSTNIDNYKLVWYREPEKRMMYFAESLGIPNGEVLVPGLVYVASGRHLSVYAFKGRKPKDILYRAPFFNCYKDGGVCLGNAKVARPKEQTFGSWIEYWEKMFWKSEFVDIIDGNPIKENLAVITKDCIESGKPFPTWCLEKSRVTLEKILK